MIALGEEDGAGMICAVVLLSHSRAGRRKHVRAGVALAITLGFSVAAKAQTRAASHRGSHKSVWREGKPDK